MSKAEKAPLLEILVARDDDVSHRSQTSTFHTLRLEQTALSFTAGVAPKSPAKKGILKRGPTLRRASSFTEGHTTTGVNELLTENGLQQQNLHPPPPPLSFKDAWDALPPLPTAPADRTRSLQMPVFFKEAAPAAQELEGETAVAQNFERVPNVDRARHPRFSSGAARSVRRGSVIGAARASQEDLPLFEEFDRPTRRGSLVPVALPRNQQPEEDEASAGTGSESEVDALEDEHAARPFHKKRWFRRLLPPCSISLAFFVVGMCLYYKKPHLAVSRFEVWRWLLFIAGTIPLYGFSKLVVYILIVGSETYHPLRGAIYYVIGIKRWLQRTLCAAFFMALFAGLFQQFVYRSKNERLEEAYWLIMKTSACVLLSFLANVLKTLCAKLMSSHFYKDSYCDKMQDALCKEYYLVALAQQRPDNESPGVAKTAVSTAMGILADQLRAASQAVLPGMGPNSALGKGTRAQAQEEVDDHLAARSRRVTSGSEGHRSAVSHVSCVSEAQKSLASITSLLSSDVQRMRMRQRTRRQSQIEYDDVVPVLPAKAGHSASFLERLHRVERHLRRNKLKLTLTERLGAAHTTDEVDSRAEAKKLAFYLFWNCKASFDSEAIELEDLAVFLPEEQAGDALEMFDCDADGRISADDVREAVLQIYENRRNLSAMLKDTKTIVGKLEFLLGICLQLLFIFFYLAIFNVNLTRIWLTISGLMLSFVFIFGNSIKTLYESVVYLFVVRPYDVGDAILLGPAQDWCTVEEITLLNTVLIKWDGSRILCPNPYLSSNTLTNVTRSQKKGETFKVMVDIGTPQEVFNRVGDCVKAHVKENTLDFSGECSVNANFGGDPMKITLSIWWSYCYNATSGRLFAARTKLLLVIAQQLHQEGILYTLPPCTDGSASVPGMSSVPAPAAA